MSHRSPERHWAYTSVHPPVQNATTCAVVLLVCGMALHAEAQGTSTGTTTATSSAPTSAEATVLAAVISAVAAVAGAIISAWAATRSGRAAQREVDKLVEEPRRFEDGMRRVLSSRKQRADVVTLIVQHVATTKDDRERITYAVVREIGLRPELIWKLRTLMEENATTDWKKAAQELLGEDGQEDSDD